MITETFAPIDRLAGGFMQTFTARAFWPLSPNPDDVCVEDIAHSLSMQCRYAGHCIEYYSVAEHAVLMYDHVVEHSEDPAVWWWALHHDDAEAYLVDVPRPVKASLPGYAAAEWAVMNCIAEALSSPGPMPSIVKQFDNRIISDERANLRAMDWGYVPPVPLGVDLKCWSPKEAEEAYLDRHYKVDNLIRWNSRDV